MPVKYLCVNVSSLQVQLCDINSMTLCLYVYFTGVTQVRLMQTIASSQQSVVINTLNLVLESEIDMLDRNLSLRKKPLFLAHVRLLSAQPTRQVTIAHHLKPNTHARFHMHKRMRLLAQLRCGRHISAHGVRSCIELGAHHHGPGPDQHAGALIRLF